MKKLAGLLTLAVAVCAAVLIIPTIRNAQSQVKPTADPKLTVTQDESTLEKAIDNYLTLTKGITGGISRFNDKERKDLLVAYPISSDKVPDIRVVIDTLAAEKDADGKTRERVIMVQSFYELPASAKTPEARRKLLELCTKWMDGHWSPGGVYVDSDGDLAWRTAINIPGRNFSVHAELVYDAVARMGPFWRSFYPLMKKELNLPDAKKTE